jgi:RimJ/RimL family protein N-acetyltransferase
MNNGLKLREFIDNDINIMERWLNKDYILKWYSDPNGWLLEIKKRKEEFKFIHHYIAVENNKPIGFCQYYDCFYAEEDWYKAQEPNILFSIDYLIGEEEYLGKGYGKQMIQLLKEEIKKKTKAKKIIVQPEKENIQSNNLLKSVGFSYDNDKKYYYLLLN